MQESMHYIADIIALLNNKLQHIQSYSERYELINTRNTKVHLFEVPLQFRRFAWGK